MKLIKMLLMSLVVLNFQSVLSVERLSYEAIEILRSNFHLNQIQIHLKRDLVNQILDFDLHISKIIIKKDSAKFSEILKNFIDTDAKLKDNLFKKIVMSKLAGLLYNEDIMKIILYYSESPKKDIEYCVSGVGDAFQYCYRIPTKFYSVSPELIEKGNECVEIIKKLKELESMYIDKDMSSGISSSSSSSSILSPSALSSTGSSSSSARSSLLSPTTTTPVKK